MISLHSCEDANIHFDCNLKNTIETNHSSSSSPSSSSPSSPSSSSSPTKTASHPQPQLIQLLNAFQQLPNRQFEPLCPEAPDMLQFKSIDEWLASLKLSRYVDNFQQAGVTTLDAVTRLSHADLSGLGIILLGHQRKIMNSIQAMRAQLSISMSEGFLVWSHAAGWTITKLLFNNQCVSVCSEWWSSIFQVDRRRTRLQDRQQRLQRRRGKKKQQQQTFYTDLLQFVYVFRFYVPVCIAASNLIDSPVALTMMYIV